MSNRAPTALPPLPEPDIYIHEDFGLGDYTVHQGYTAEQVEAIRRETVEACADLCAAEQAENRDLAKGSKTAMYDWMADGAGLCRGAILALLPVKSDSGHSAAADAGASTAPLPEGEPFRWPRWSLLPIEKEFHDNAIAGQPSTTREAL